ncbi:putative metal-binding motif-containing protein [Candidatus Woesearchaeota archaeon]|nr:putative metal-binding motif-containing protein [Candidatus Woesearchaeota archaeon]
MKTIKYFLIIAMILLVPSVFASQILTSSNIDVRPLKDINMNVGQTTNIVLTVYSDTAQAFTADIKINDTSITDFTGTTISSTTISIGPAYMYIYPLSITPLKTGQFTLSATITGSSPSNIVTTWVVGQIFSSTSCVDGDGDGYQAQSCGGRDPNDANINIIPTNCLDIGPDVDGDGQINNTLPNCVGIGTDCNDNNKNVYIGALEINDDGIDNNCDGVLGTTSAPATSGGGGGGGSPGELYCTPELFNCTQWSNCNPDGTMTRACAPIKKCTGGIKAQTTKSCTYYPKEEKPAVIVNETNETKVPEITGAFLTIGPLKLTKNQALYGGIPSALLLLILIGLGIYKLTRPKIIEHKLEEKTAPIIEIKSNKVAEEFLKKKRK